MIGEIWIWKFSVDVFSIIIVIRLGGLGGLEDGSGYGVLGGGGGEILVKGI